MIPFDALHACIALSPVAVYLMLMGLINLGKRPFLTTGSRDVAALGIALTGLFLCGPAKLFLPESAFLRIGPWVWPLLLALYLLFLTLMVLVIRPRLVIYNITNDQLRPLLGSVVADLDKAAQWAGDSLTLPSLGVQLHIDPQDGFRYVQLVSAGPRQNFAGWRRLELVLGKALRESAGGNRNPLAVSLLFFSALIIGIVTFMMINEPQTIADSLREVLRQ